MDKIESIMRILPQSVREIFCHAEIAMEKLQEIRLRVEEPLCVLYEGKEFFVNHAGRMQGGIQGTYLVSAKDIRETMEYISSYSLYAFEEEMRQGYITVRGGHRVGVAGRAIGEKGSVKNLKNISFLNIRLAHEVKGCADIVLPYMRCQNRIHHTLLISPPRCGKTTLLRDLIRQLSDGENNYDGMNVGVVDERSEIGACYMGKPQNDLGCRTDVLDGCPKVEGMMMLVRSMAPQVIAVDEIGSRADVEAMAYVMNCGIRLLATVHGNSIEDLQNKPVLGRMIRERMFERYVLLEAGCIGVIRKIFDERGCVLYAGERSRTTGGLYAC